MRRFIRSHPLLTAALGGAAIGPSAAVLLLRFGDAPGAGTFTRSSRIFAAASLPAGWWYHLVFGWAWKGSRASEFLAILPRNGAAWAVALTALVRRLSRSARAWRLALGSADSGTALAVLVWMVGMPVTASWDGLRGLVLLAQLPGWPCSPVTATIRTCGTVR